MTTATLERPEKAKATRPTRTGSRKPSPYLTYLLRLMALETGKAVRFEIAADPSSKVFIAGTFNGWNPHTHPLNHCPADGVFRVTLLLPSGTHEYKFVVNGVWQRDARCPHCVPDAPGGPNSLLRI